MIIVNLQTPRIKYSIPDFIHSTQCPAQPNPTPTPPTHTPTLSLPTLSPPFSHPPPPPNPTPPEPPDSEDDVFARLESLKSGIEIVFDHAKSWTKYAKEISNYVEKRNALGLCVYKKYIYIYIGFQYLTIMFDICL